MWILTDFGINSEYPTDLYCDNTSVIALANNPMFHARTKHIEIYQRFVRDHIQHAKQYLASSYKHDGPNCRHIYKTSLNTSLSTSSNQTDGHARPISLQGDIREYRKIATIKLLSVHVSLLYWCL